MTATQLAQKASTPDSPLAEAAAAAPISAKALDKIRSQRRKVEGLHAAVMARTDEHRRLREHLQALKISITQLKDSWEFREAQKVIKNEFVFGRDDQNQPPPARRQEQTPESIQKLALLERDLEATAVEAKIAAPAQITASERWQAEKTILDRWIAAVRNLGPAARSVLDAMPRPGTDTMGVAPGQTDFRLGIPGRTLPTIR